MDNIDDDINEKIIKAIMEYIKTIPDIEKRFNKTYSSQKYDLEELFPTILDVLKNKHILETS